ncbi:MAG: hypothetical protein M3O70_18190 [Actinomycetota bacterium]|nr:hypothetical protein [Actinomycetota bacterium]
MEIENGGSARLRFSPVDLAPGAAKPLAEFDLVVLSTMAGMQLGGRWTARSTYAPGIAEGTLPLDVTERAATALELMHETSDDS